MKPYLFTLFAALALLVAACAVPGAAPTEDPEPTDPARPTDPVDPVTDPEYSLEWLEGLPEGSILLQLDYEPSFSREEVFYVFGRVPAFTLFSDGTVIFESQDPETFIVQVLTVKLTPEETLALLRDVRAAGFEGLEDQLDFCYTDENGQQVCIADAAYTILRAMLPSGELREVKTYANFSNDPGAFEEIVLIMNDFEHADAVMYMPEKAVLFLRALVGDFEVPLQEWPLAEDRIPPLSEALAAIVLDAAEYETFVNAVRQNAGDFYFGVGERAFAAYLVPWLPGADYTEEVLAAFPPGPVEEPFLVIQAAAIADLAEQLGIAEDEIVVSSFEPVTWPDGCLGIVIPDTACTMALVPGYQLFLEAGGQTYEYRADSAGSQVLQAGEGSLPPIENPDA